MKDWYYSSESKLWYLHCKRSSYIINDRYISCLLHINAHSQKCHTFLYKPCHEISEKWIFWNCRWERMINSESRPQRIYWWNWQFSHFSCTSLLATLGVSLGRATATIHICVVHVSNGKNNILFAYQLQILSGWKSISYQKVCL